MNHEPGSPFLQTRWSLIQRVQSGGEVAAVALGELCAAYWFPLYGWARRSGASPEDAEDLVQGFFSDVLRKHLFEKKIDWTIANISSNNKHTSTTV